MTTTVIIIQVYEKSQQTACARSVIGGYSFESALIEGLKLFLKLER